jgi:H+/Cl- antiporter ClcA
VTSPQQAVALMRTAQYRRLLVLAALLGVPIAVVSYFFLALLNNAKNWTSEDIPHALGLNPVPRWWVLIPLLVAGIVVGLVAHYVPGRGGNTPVEGLHAGRDIGTVELLGILVAAFVSVGFGPVIGPEGPTIALGGGLVLVALRAARRAATGQAAALLSITGSNAAISTLLGSPLIGAVFLLEASGLGGTTAAVVLVPGLLASGVGALVFTGMGSLTGLHPLTLSAGKLPDVGTPTVPQLLWAVAIGIAAPLLCAGLRRGARALADPVNARPLWLTPLAGLAVGGLAIGYSAITDHDPTQVLFSGENALPSLLQTGSATAWWIVLLLLVAKSLAYGISLACFRGGPIFPAVFLGAAGGVVLSNLPGLPLVAGAAIGVAAMSTGMLRLPISSVLLCTLLFGQDGIQVLPLTIVATVLAYVVIMLIDPPPPVRPPTAADAGAGRAPAPQQSAR